MTAVNIRYEKTGNNCLLSALYSLWVGVLRLLLTTRVGIHKKLTQTMNQQSTKLLPKFSQSNLL